MRRFLVPAIAVVVLGGCTATPAPSGLPSPSAPSLPVVEPSTVDGATLIRLAAPDGSPAYLQVLDVTKVRIDQVLGDRDPGTAAAGAYYPGVPSPAFRRIGTAQMQRSCRDRYGARTFSAMNVQFFEDYDASTPLSFPVKSDGTVHSGGSSPYGPVPGPRAAYYRTVTLRALSWDAHGATIVAYHPDTGAPLDGLVPDAIVTYLYADHPSYVLDHDPPNRYQLAGLLDGTHLAILTLTHARLTDGAKLLGQQGVRGDIVTFDGGISTYLWTAAQGELVHITNKDGMLPHFLCVHGT